MSFSPPDSSPLSVTYERDPFLPGLLTEIAPHVRKVVLLKASRIGDFINTFPAFQALRRALPNAEMTIITLPMLADLAARCPHLDRYVPFPGYPGLAEQFFDARRAATFFQAMQAEAFDLAIQIQGTGVYSNPFCLMLGARWTAGFIRDNDPPGRLAAAIPWPMQGQEIRRNLALTEFLGAPAVDLQPSLALRDQEREAAETILAGLPAPWIGIHTSARDQTRRWPTEKFAQAAARLQTRHGGTVLLIGEERDRVAMEEAVRPTGARYHNLAGQTNLPVTAALLQRLSVFLTNDTGPAHIAYAVGAPTVTIFGGGDPARNGPVQQGPFRVLAHPIDCRPCETGSCPIGLQCLERITIEAAVSAAEEILR